MEINHSTGSILSLVAIDTTVAPPAGEANLFTIYGTGGLVLPAGNGTTELPDHQVGLIRYNTTTGKVELSNGVDAWNVILDTGNVSDTIDSTYITDVTDPLYATPSDVDTAISTTVDATYITTLVDATYVNVSGDSMSSGANLTFSGGGEVLGLPNTPSASNAATSKYYVDSMIQGLSPKQSVRVATTTAGTLSSSFAAGQIVDGITLVLGDRILIKDQADRSENGIYIVTAGTPTRATDMDVWTEVPNAFMFVQLGTLNADTGWVCTSNAGGTIETNLIDFVQFSGVGSYTAGTGLTLTGTEFSITSPIATSIGGTGLTSIGTANQVLGVNAAADGLEYKTVTAGTGISVNNAAGSITIAATNNGTVTSIEVTTGTGMTVNSGASDTITSSGTFALELDADLAALSGVATTGLITRTGSGTFDTSTITGTAGNITVTNGDGVAGDPTIDLATVGTPVSASFVKVTTDDYGRVSATTPVVASDITSLVNTEYVNVSGDTMTGTLTFTSGTVTGLAAPSATSDAATKLYVDSVATGLQTKPAVLALADSDLSGTYDNGTSGVGATINLGQAASLTIDGVTFDTQFQGILVNGQTNSYENGRYYVSQVGNDVDTDWILTRCTYCDEPSEIAGSFIFVQDGTTYGGTGWTAIIGDPLTFDVGVDPINYTQFSGAGSYTAGTGLTLTGTEFSITSPIATTIGGTGLTSIGSANQVLGVNAAANGLEYKTITAGTGISVDNAAGSITINATNNGTVTSVGLSAPSFLTVSNSPVTSSGTLTLSLATQTANTVFAGPTSGGDAAPTFRALGYDDLPLALYKENPSTPSALTTTGTNSVAIGSGATATANNTVAIGDGSNAHIAGSKVFANGKFSVAGDAQAGLYVLRNTTTNATETEIFVDGSSQQLVIPTGAMFTFVATFAAVGPAGAGASYKIEGGIVNNSGTTSFIGVPSKTILGESNAAWDVAVTADDTNDALKFTVTGEAATTIKWVATVLTTEVIV